MQYLFINFFSLSQYNKHDGHLNTFKNWKFNTSFFSFSNDIKVVSKFFSSTNSLLCEPLGENNIIK